MNEYLNIAEAATRLGVSTQTIRNYVESGRVDAVRVGPRLIRINASSLDALVVAI